MHVVFERKGLPHPAAPQAVQQHHSQTMANLSGIKIRKKHCYRSLDHKNSQRNLGSLVTNLDLACSCLISFGCVDCPEVLCSFGIEANVQTVKDGLLRHQSACCSSPTPWQWALPTRCPSDEPDPLLKDSDFTRSQPMCSCSSICLSTDAPHPHAAH